MALAALRRRSGNLCGMSMLESDSAGVLCKDSGGRYGPITGHCGQEGPGGGGA